MAKLKTQTPQELYRARKQREEQEKEALLPPGLYNHGNTCFMNSVLQGLIATRLLSDLVYSALLPPSPRNHPTSLIDLRRSPQLTNGHGLGREYEKEWVQGMPIGDVFLDVMLKAWNIQRNRRRENLSPRDILGAIGRKYDQYLDFAQQDAHEFLRQLLDAMRMEELDVIKKRQPPPPVSKKKRRRGTITPSSISPAASPEAELTDPLSSPQPIPEEERLMSVADMIFGGKLTSILVCQKCKHISQTYEDFNDLSLSIKAEDYARERRRDRLKNLAKKLTSFPTTTLGTGAELQRSSSVPPSPRERESGQLGAADDPPIVDNPRRLSLDVVADQGVGNEISTPKEEVVEATHENEVPPTNGHLPVTDEKHVGFAGQPKSERREKKGKGDKDDDGWTKIGRRISMSVGLGKGTKERKGRSRERSDSKGERERDVPKEQDEDSISEDVVMVPSTAQISIAEVGHVKEATPEIRVLRPSPSPQQQKSRSSPQSSILTGSLTSLPRFPHIQRPQSKRGKSPRPPKPSAAELEYLRQILADVTPSSSSPFAIFKPTNHNASSSSSPANSAQSVWMKMGQLPGIEECLRMFTAVEVLDGENMVGCRRCWKIANGVYTPHRHDNNEEDCPDEDSDSIEDRQISPAKDDLSDVKFPSARGQASSAPASPSPPIPMSLSSPSISLYSHPNASDGVSISSLPTTVTSAAKSAKSARGFEDIPSDLDLNEAFMTPLSSPRSRSQAATPGGLPIPVISTTAPESPTTARATISSAPQDAVLEDHVDRSPEVRNQTYIPSTSSTASVPSPNAPPIAQSTQHLNSTQDSLHTPRIRHHHQNPDTDTTEESSGAESDASIASIHSERSSTSMAPPGINQEQLGDPKLSPQPPSKKPSRPKPVIMRPAYKRYLIATPPPVLVVHLKRFQQLSKTSMLSFSNGFKKLDDYVTFPEYLDLTPFLAPKKEDFGLGKKGKGHKSHKHHSKDVERCMYRLYAVVVHIGNMLGGHYVAYTALPCPPEVKSPVHSLPATPGSESEPHLTTPSKPQRQWAYISDIVVKLTTLEEVLKAKAYICMYERI